MKTKFALAVSLALAVSSTLSQKAHAWGQYGHEQGNDAAIEILNGASSPLGACFAAGDGQNGKGARYVMRRMAVTPDIEWKADMTLATLSPADKSKRFDDDKYEHPMHFDEVDAWVPNPKPGEIAGLLGTAQKFTNAKPGEYEYEKIYPFFKDRLQKNAGYVTQIDPGKKLKDPASPSVNEVTDHGTAPWRALQMYRLGTEALKKGDLKLAMLYLGTMGHYVCDMSMPYHASLNFDGEYNPDGKGGNLPSAGIHHEIDTGVLPQKGKDANDVYPTFPTGDKVVEAGSESIRGKGVKGLTEADIIPDIFQMIDDGYPNVAGFLKDYTDECALANGGAAATQFKTACAGEDGVQCDGVSGAKGGKARPKKTKPGEQTASTPANPTSGHGGHGSVPSTDGALFCTVSPPTKPGGRSSTKALHSANEQHFASKVLPTVEQRIGACSGLLARLWESAYEAAGSPKLSGCDSVEFDQSFAIQNYPKPSKDGPHGFLPAGYTPGHR